MYKGTKCRGPNCERLLRAHLTFVGSAIVALQLRPSVTEVRYHELTTGAFFTHAKNCSRSYLIIGQLKNHKYKMLALFNFFSIAFQSRRPVCCPGSAKTGCRRSSAAPGPRSASPRLTKPEARRYRLVQKMFITWLHQM